MAGRHQAGPTVVYDPKAGLMASTRSRTGKPGARGLVLFHGAGGNRDHRVFLALEERLDRPVARINFPYRQKAIAAGKTRWPPDRMPKLVAAVNQAVNEAAEAWGIEPGSLAVGGHSMGGRAASMAVADGMAAAGLLLLSYPLHPPGKPDRLRVEHFADIGCPVLLVQGRRDPFGRPDEFAEHLPTIGGRLTELWIDGNHDPTGSQRAVDLVTATIGGWMAGLSGT